MTQHPVSRRLRIPRSFTMSREVYDRLQAHCLQKNLFMSGFVEDAIEHFITRAERQEKLGRMTEEERQHHLEYEREKES